MPFFKVKSEGIIRLKSGGVLFVREAEQRVELTEGYHTKEIKVTIATTKYPLGPGDNLETTWSLTEEEDENRR